MDKRESSNSNIYLSGDLQDGAGYGRFVALRTLSNALNSTHTNISNTLINSFGEGKNPILEALQNQTFNEIITNKPDFVNSQEVAHAVKLAENNQPFASSIDKNAVAETLREAINQQTLGTLNMVCINMQTLLPYSNSIQETFEQSVEKYVNEPLAEILSAQNDLATVALASKKLDQEWKNNLDNSMFNSVYGHLVDGELGTGELNYMVGYIENEISESENIFNLSVPAELKQIAEWDRKASEKLNVAVPIDAGLDNLLVGQDLTTLHERANNLITYSNEAAPRIARDQELDAPKL